MKLAIFAAAFLAFLGSVSWGADFKKGTAAHGSGDYTTALRELKPLAKQGDALAQYILGYMYANGQGVPQDFKTAVKWYRRAAEQGDVFAQYYLGQMYDWGLGVPQDIVYAHMWFNLAAANGPKGVGKMRGDFAKSMIPSQIAEAQKLARECLRKKYKGC